MPSFGDVQGNAVKLCFVILLKDELPRLPVINLS